MAESAAGVGGTQWIYKVLASLITVMSTVVIPVPASASQPLTVTFTFDDGFADQLTAQQLLHKYGMTGTFYISSALIGLPGYLTRADLDILQADGQEIGGHTATHQDLTQTQPRRGRSADLPGPQHPPRLGLPRHLLRVPLCRTQSHGQGHRPALRIQQRPRGR